MLEDEKVSSNEAEVTDEKLWPAVNYAYDFVMPSYQLVTSRFEAADTRITALLTFMATMTLGVPIIARTIRPDISFTATPFVFGMAIFTLAAVLGVVGRTTGSLTLPDPMVLYEKSLEISEWEFKKNQIYFAGKHFNANVEAIRKKGNCAIAMTVALILEVGALIVWFVGLPN